MKKRNVIISILALAIFSMMLAACSPAAKATGYLSLDINPGVEINVDDNGQVLAVTAINPEAEEAIGGMDYTGNAVEEVAETLIYRLALAGHLTAEDVHVLLSSDNSLSSKKSLAKVIATLEEQLAVINPNAVLLSKSFDVDDDVLEKAREMNMTAGKYLYVHDVLDSNDDLKWADVADIRLADIAKMDDSLYNDSLYDNSDSPYDHSSNTPYDDSDSPYTEDSNYAASTSSAGTNGSPYDNNSPYDDSEGPYDNDSGYTAPASTPAPADDSPYDDSPYQEPAPAPAPAPAPSPAPTNDSPYDDSPYQEPTPAPAPAPAPADDSPYQEDSPYEAPDNDSGYEDNGSDYDDD